MKNERKTNHAFGLACIAFRAPSFSSQGPKSSTYRAEAWHYRIFTDFLKDSTEGKAEVIACSWNDIKGQITPESQYSTAKNSYFTAIKNFDLKPWEKKDRRLSLLGSIGGIPELFDKKFEKRTVAFSFFTALDPTEYWGMIREWVYLFLQTVK